MKTTNTKSNNQGSVMIIGLFVTVALLVTAGIFAYRQHQHAQAIAKERAEYAQAEHDLSNLANQIVAKFGKSISKREVNSCGHTSSDFSTGILYCDTNIYLLYDSTGMGDAAEMATQSKSIGGIFLTLHPTTGNHYITGTFIRSGLECFVDYSTHDGPEDLSNLGYYGLNNMPNIKQGTLIQLNCAARHPKAAYYPIKNS